MRVLLLSDIPPSSNYSGGLHIAQLCRLVPPGSLDAFVVLNPSLAPTIPHDLAWIPIRYQPKPQEHAWRPVEGRLGAVAALAGETRIAVTSRRRVADAALRAVDELGPDIVWCLLEGQTMIAVAERVRANVAGPFVTQVMDPPGWWLRAHRVDGVSRGRLLAAFGTVVRRSDRCGTASWAMAAEYEERYGVESIPLVPSIDESEIQISAGAGERDRRKKDVLVIGIAGQIYAEDAFDALENALDTVAWRVGGRDVVFRVLAATEPSLVRRSNRVEFLGWRSQSDAIALLAQCDVLYCPYWFAAEFEEEVRLSFPSKLTTYLAAGRPVLFHGPAHASPAVFLERERAGVCCTSRSPAEVVEALTAIASDDDLRATVVGNGLMAVRLHLSVPAQRMRFARFLGVAESSLA